MKHLKKNIVSNISSNNNIVSKNSKNYADFGQKKKPTGLTGKKNRLFKSLGIGAMAVFMGILTVLGTACTPTQTNTNLESGSLASGNNMEAVKPAPSPLGLDPQNDPIIYTTESGLEIKYGGIDYNMSLGSGPLKGYPYFTMGTYNSLAVNWIIIGIRTGETFWDKNITNYLFSNWKTNYTNTKFGQYFFTNIYDTTTPAGAAINSVIPSKSYIQDFVSNAKPIQNAEIPSGCALSISECSLYGNQFYNSSTQCVYPSSNLKTSVDNLYTSGLGLTTAQKNLIVSQTFSTITGTSSSTTTSSTQSLFLLAGRGEKYNVSTYLTSNALRQAYTIGASTLANWWLRSMASNSVKYGCCIYTSGALYTTAQDINQYSNNTGVRPACIISLS